MSALPTLSAVDLRPRKRRRGARPEDALHAGIWKALQTILHPDVVAWSVENRANGMLEGGRRRARGCIAGIPDLHFHWPHAYSAMVELKAAKGATSDAQKAMHARLRRAGIPVAVCRSLDDVISFLRAQGCPMRGVY